MKTAVQIIEESIKQPWDGSQDSTAEVIVKNLKAAGYIIVGADDLVKQISDSMGGGQHE